jgi:hypothetical protein
MFQCLRTHVSSVSSVFKFILQMLHLDVSKADRVLHVIIRLLLPVRRRGSRAEA